MNTHRILPALAAALAIGAAGFAQAAPVVSKISDAGGPTPEDMVNSLLSADAGISIVPGSVAYTGSNAASGTFTGGGSNQSNSIGIQTGIILSSGDAAFVSNVPNTNGGAGIDNGTPGNALLDGLGQGTTVNASILSFNFIPTSNQVQFSYVFGSEEYNEFVNSGFNDVFGFFVNGENFALIPGTDTPVAINNVNCGEDAPDGSASGVNASNCQFFRDNPPGTNTIDTQLDGLTVILSFVANVIANEENLIQLGVADVSDGILDSAVFIAAGTFQSCGGPGQPPCGNGGPGPGQVPEPGSLALLGLGLLGAFAARRRR